VVRRAVLEAGKDLDFFQVIMSLLLQLIARRWLRRSHKLTTYMMRGCTQVVNHGVPEQALRDMDAACEELNMARVQ
jgi:hypothetical protein